VLGDVELLSATADPSAGEREPTAVDVDLGATTSRVLTAPIDQGRWNVLQAGDGSFAASVDAWAQLPTVAEASTVEVLVTTEHGAKATVHDVVDVADGIELPTGIVRSVAAVHRSVDGTIVGFSASAF